MSNWAWTLIGGAVTLAAAISVILWQAFKHLDLKIERLADKIDEQRDHFDKKLDDQRSYFDKKLDDQRSYFDKKLDDQRSYFDKKFDEQRADSDKQRADFDKKFDQVMGIVTETVRLIAGHDSQIKAQEKETDRLSATVFGSQQFSAPGRRQDGEHAPEPVPPVAAAASGEGAAASAGGPEPAPPVEVTPV